MRPRMPGSCIRQPNIALKLLITLATAHVHYMMVSSTGRMSMGMHARLAVGTVIACRASVSARSADFQATYSTYARPPAPGRCPPARR